MKGVAIGVSLVALAVYSGFLYEDHAAGRLHHHDHSDHYHDHSHSEKVMLPEKLLYPSRDPDRVILNLTETPETSIAATAQRLCHIHDFPVSLHWVWLHG